MIIVIIMIKKERINSAIKVQKEQESKHQGTKPKAIVYSNWSITIQATKANKTKQFHPLLSLLFRNTIKTDVIKRQRAPEEWERQNQW